MQSLAYAPRCKSSTRRCARLFALSLCIVSVFMLQGCLTTSIERSLEPDPLVVSACPALTPLSDPTFGGTTAKLVEVAGQYRECRCAATRKCD